MDKNEVMKILETAKDKNGEVPMRLVRQAFEKLPEPCKDTISRQDAIDILDAYQVMIENGEENPYAWARLRMSELPPAQPEPLTDKEQRIFLAAMEREEEVCKQVDAECRDCREPYEDSLVSICHEITRKVKGALWN